MPSHPADHPKHFETDSMNIPSRWDTWQFAFLTLWSRPETALPVLEWLATAEIPPNSVLYWLDNSGGSMAEKLRAEWQQRLRHRFRKVVWVECGEPFRSKSGETIKDPRRHVHVARLYNLIFPRVMEEAVVVLEDDMVPPLEGVRLLLDRMQDSDRVGLVAGVYRDRVNPGKICAALDKSRWVNAPDYDALPKEPFEIGMTGGGFTLLLNRALQQVLPVHCKAFAEGHTLGWDGKLCVDLTALGYRLLAHPGVMCAHLCPEIAAYDAGLRKDA